MNQLIIEASGAQLALLLATSEDCFSSLSEPDGRHDQRLLADVTDLLSRAGLSFSDIHRLGVGIGPGSFTGIRVALASAQGIAMGLDLPIYPIDSLALLALSQGAGRWHVAIDARLGELYHASYQVESGQVMVVSAPELIKQEELALSAGFTAIGDGWSLVGRNVPAAQCKPSAHWLSVFEHLDPRPAQDCEPAYLRNTVSWKKLSEQPSPLSK